MFGQHLDGIAAVAKDAAIAVNKGDAALAGRRIHERRILGHEAKIFSVGFDFAQIHGTDGAILNRQVVIFGGAIIGNSERLWCHDGSPFAGCPWGQTRIARNWTQIPISAFCAVRDGDAVPLLTESCDRSHLN